MLVRAFLLLFQLLFLVSYADEDVNKVRDQLIAIESDAEQVYREADARARLIDIDLKASGAVYDRVLPEIDNLLFRMKGMLEPSLNIRRQAKLAAKYESDFNRTVDQMRTLHDGIAPQVKVACEQIEKGREIGIKDEKRQDLLNRSRAELQSVILKLKKMQELQDEAGKSLSKALELRDETAAFASKFEALVARANELPPSEQRARAAWKAEQSELSVIPLRLKTLEVLSDRSKALLEGIKLTPLPKEKQREMAERAEAIEGFYKGLTEFYQQIIELSRGIEDQMAAFDSKSKIFKELGIQIIAPFQNGLQTSLEDYARRMQAQLIEASLSKERSLVEVNRLRMCIGQIEEESDTVLIPDLKGLPVEEASALLQQVNLKVDRRVGEPAPQRGMSSRVYEQSPPADQRALPGSAVIIRAYGIYAPLVPDLTGKSIDEANAELAKVGLEGVAKMGEVAPDKEVEDKVYSQLPRAYSTVEDGSVVEFTYYSKIPLDESEQKFSATPFYVLCRLYVPRLKPNAPSKGDLTMADVDFIQRGVPFVLAIQERALDRYSLTFFEPNKALSTFIQIIGREVKTGLSFQYDGALLLEVVAIVNKLEDLKLRTGGNIDFSEPDPLSFLILSEGSGLFKGTGVNGDVQLTWKGGPVIQGWSGRMREASFSLFRQLL